MVLAYLRLRAFEQYHDLRQSFLGGGPLDCPLDSGFEVGHMMKSKRRSFSTNKVGNRPKIWFGVSAKHPIQRYSKSWKFNRSFLFDRNSPSLLTYPIKANFLSSSNQQPVPNLNVLSQQNGFGLRNNRPTRRLSSPSPLASPPQTLLPNLVPPQPNKNSDLRLQKPPLYNHRSRPSRPRSPSWRKYNKHLPTSHRFLQHPILRQPRLFDEQKWESCRLPQR